MANVANGRRGAKRSKCESYVVFEKNLDRSRAFIRVFGESDRDKGAPSNDERELLRGSVVFAIGALDNFMHELILELVPQFGGSRGAMKEPLKKIAREDPALALRVALAASVDDGQREFKDALDSWLESQSFHGVEKVVSAVGFVGLKLDEGGLRQDWRQRFEHYTGMRHRIVHRGERPSVKRDNANECADLVESIGAAVNRDAVRFYH